MAPLIALVSMVMIPLSLGDVHVSLNGVWQVTDNQGIDINGTVPGSVYTALQNAGVIDDPYYRYNDLRYKWVAHRDWTYHTIFQVSSKFLAYSNIDLEFGGLDTVAEVTLNNDLVLQTNNMFRRYSVSVKDKLKTSNKISLAFASPVRFAKNASASFPYDVPPDCPPDVQKGECHVNFIRKEAASFSWDWGPAFPTSGPWRNVTLHGYNKTTIDYIVTNTTMSASGQKTWLLNGIIYLKGKTGITGELDVILPETRIRKTWKITIPEDNRLSFQLPCPGVDTWWPNGHGNQTLYDVVVSLTLPEVTGSEVTRRKVTVGFRTVDLVQEPIKESEGLSFYFRINGVAIFMKGSNWIPADSFQERITSEYLTKLLYSAKVAKMNMLRVWGGGVYESSEFYSLCDRLGILIWQDFMFACSLYPANQEFLDNVREEVKHQTRRLANHPSIALWAGNNENEAALIQNWYQTNPHYDRYYRDYVKLYVDTVREAVIGEDTSRPFVTSSPSNGVESEREGWVAKNPQDPTYGDVHYYNYTCDSWNWKCFPRPRFASEFGIQSWSSLATLKPVSVPGDWGIFSNFSNHRQHHGNGNHQMVDELSIHMKLTNHSDPEKKFSSYIYQTQINQAVGIKTEAELYRRLQGNLIEGEGHTMGALYWQLNDIWQAPTWASIEYGGRWKMLHYYARKFYSEVLLSPHLDGDKLQVYYIHETPAFLTPEDNHLYSGVQNNHLSPGKRDYLRYKTHLDNVIHKIPRTDLSISDKDTYEPISDKDAYEPISDKDAYEPISDEDAYRPISDEDIHQPVTGTGNKEVTLSLKMYSWDSLTPKKVWKSKFRVPDPVSSVVYEGSIATLLTESGCPSINHCFITVTTDSAPPGENWILLSNFTIAQGLKRPNIQIYDVTSDDDRTFTISLKTDSIAPFLWLETEDFPGFFSDNGFILTEPEIQVTFYSWVAIPDADKLRSNLKVMSLLDVYDIQ